MFVQYDMNDLFPVKLERVMCRRDHELALLNAYFYLLGIPENLVYLEVSPIKVPLGLTVFLNNGLLNRSDPYPYSVPGPPPLSPK